MSVSKRVQYAVWDEESNFPKKLLAVQTYIYNNIQVIETSRCERLRKTKAFN